LIVPVYLRFNFFLVIGEFKFGIASLLNKKELLQVGDPVQFQVTIFDLLTESVLKFHENNYLKAHPTDPIAVNIQATNEKLRSVVEAMKGNLLDLQIDHSKYFIAQNFFV